VCADRCKGEPEKTGRQKKFETMREEEALKGSEWEIT
jgi:hypothetical protein